MFSWMVGPCAVPSPLPQAASEQSCRVSLFVAELVIVPQGGSQAAAAEWALSTCFLSFYFRVNHSLPYLNFFGTKSLK